MSNLRMKLQTLCIALMLGVLTASAQEIRYVKMASAGGNNANSGKDWTNAKADIQAAINDLVTSNLTGEVWVAAGTYYPTETTESSSSPYFKSFKIPEGITVRGGFAGDETSASGRQLKSDKYFGKVKGDGSSENTGNLDGEAAGSGRYVYETILSGDLDQSKPAKAFEWNPTKGQFNVTFYGNSYHVVWFAMRGFDADGRAIPLQKAAKLEGCIVQNGHAYTSNATSAHPHVGYGGGIYMVANSFVYNCEVRNCDASRNGGGIYMDGGGIVRRTHVHDCQAIGIGTDFGLGGGICEDGAKHNSKANPVVVAQSVVTNCVGRQGGGMALTCDQTTAANKYTVVSNSTLVTNNTAQVEGGGVYTYKGGGLASMTIVRNKCNGSGIMQNDVVTGRAGGVYSRDAAYIGNNVIWGNECAANQNVQYASSRSSLNDSEKTHFYYNAISKADNTDWSGARKMGVLSLADDNETSGTAGSLGYPLFFNPTKDAGYSKEMTPAKSGDINWTVSSESYLTHAGISTVDLDYDGLTPAPQGKSWDMQFGEFNARPTLGAFIAQVEDLSHAKDGSGTATKVTFNGVEYDYAFFVDPEFINAGDNPGDNGVSWEHPARFLGNVLDFIESKKSTYENKKVAIFVKQGTVDNTRTWGSTRIRQTSLEIPSNVSLFGSFSSKLTGTTVDAKKRNVVATPTVISGKLLDKYEYHLAHLISIEVKKNITLDGFKLTLANATSTELSNTNRNGAAITIKSSSESIKFKNIIVSNSQAEYGTAIYADVSKAEFENCIFHNNTTSHIMDSGIIYATNGSSLSFAHCDVLRNVGHAAYMGTENAETTWKNTIFYGNLDRYQADTNCEIGNGNNPNSLAAFSGNTAKATGDHCMFDAKSAEFKEQFNNNDTGNEWQYNLQYKFAEGAGQGYPRFINPTKNSGYSEHGDNTYYGRATSFEPHNNNPVVNNASYTDAHTTWGTDLIGTTRDFGGTPDIGAVENHKTEQYDEEGNEVENAYVTGQPAYKGIMYVRDYTATGTKMDTYDYTDGNYTKNSSGKGIYNAKHELLDGSSWNRAINGNAMYAYVPGTISTEEAVNTYVQAKIETTEAKQGFKLSINGHYLATSGSNIILTDEANATVWSVSTSATGAAQTSITNGRRYFWVMVNTTRTYLKLAVSGSNGTLSFASGNNNGNDITVENGLKLSRTVSSRKVYIRTNTAGTALQCNTTNTYNTITATKYTDSGTTKLTETFVNAAGNSTGITKVMTKAGDSRVSIYKELHVYESLTQLNNITGDFKPVTYNIANLNYKEIDVPDVDSDGNELSTTHKITVDGDPIYLKSSDGSLTMDNTKVSSTKYALIKAGSAKLNDLVYIYDVTEKKYVSSDFTLKTTTNDTEKWRIKQSSKEDAEHNRLNIIPASVSENSETGAVADEATGWNWNSGTSTLALVNRTENASQWVFENDLQYEVWNTTVTTPGGSENINGLQYAVNESNKNLGLVTREVTVTEHYNKGDVTLVRTYQDLPANTQDAQVWVAAGVYQNYSNYGADPTGYVSEKTTENINTGYGYLMRNHVKVYGGFPAIGTPGMDERHPQLTDKVAMSAANIAKGLNYKDFETILQTQASGKTNQGSVLAHPYECAVTEKFHSNRPRSRVVYEGAEWDGFTIRNGYRSGFATTTDGGRRVGGPGVLVYENVVIRNCIVRDNELSGKNQCRGGGIYCDGGILENCYVLDNKTNCSTSNFGGGIYMIQGTMFNSVIAGNQLVGTANPQGSGIFIESAKFYNNTIVNNTGGPAVGIYSASKASADLIVYNSIIIAGAGQRILQRADTTTPTEFVHCYLKSDQVDGDGVHSILNGKVNGNAYVIIRDNETGPLTTNARVRKNKIYLGNETNTVDATGFTYAKATDLTVFNPFAKEHATAVANYDYRIEQKSVTAGNDYNCVNAATEDIGNAELPDFDMDYTDRIQDCHLDIGAYEYNGAYAIKPEPNAAGQAIFYVTPNGYGTSAGNDPENAACAQKLQKILDAAGRYKYVHPEQQVIVKVANSYAMQQEGEPFKYYATRTTDITDQDVRVYSIEVPRGVELWGGYTDVALDKNGNTTSTAWSNDVNGFYTKDAGNTVDHRNITKYPTYFDSYYYNKDQKSAANTYHVITFTDRIYDPEGYAYLKDETAKIKDQNADLSTGRALLSNDESQFAHMSTKVSGNVIMDGENPKEFAGNYASNRAVIDGIFVTGGSANGSVSDASTTLNINGFGGAAIVPDYGYVRNCIIQNNTATNGGALALTHGALVSGSLIMYNNAENMGGGIYFFEDGAQLSNGTVVSAQAPDGEVLDYNMAHVLTSTIVANKAQQGGGVWYANDYSEGKYYKINARLNSVAVWQNEANDQNNVFGIVNPEQPTEDETDSEIFYPFSYSIIQNMRASGTNNQSVDPLNYDGVRFVDKTYDIGQSEVNQNKTADEASASELQQKYINFGYYGLTHYSMLCSTGMPKSKYNQLKKAIAISDVDLLGTNRISADNNFVEIGARALAKSWPTKQLMLRLFVANEGVDKATADKFMELTGTKNSAEEYYSQVGSSFAYPFNSLQDALEYVKRARNGKIITDNTDAQNLPFEILVGKGEYFPQEDLNGDTKSVWAHTFAIPEGVTIIGGFNPQGGSTTYYGRYYKKGASFNTSTPGSIYKNVDVIPTGGPASGVNEIGRGNKYGIEDVTVGGKTITFQQWDIQDIADRRAMNDNNKNGIIEPWEFLNQTIISGNAVNGETDGVYHVMTAVADANAVGNMPKVQKTNSAFVGSGDPSKETGYQWKEEGQQIRLNGLIITGGNALTYLKTALDDYGSYIFYQGAGLQVDGNRYNTSLSGNPVFHNSAAYGVGYRDIPVSITNCQFRNNKAGYGGAISSNGSLSIFASSFEQNLAIAQTETPKAGEHWISNVGSSSVELSKVMYPGQGGAILATRQLSAFNTLFANNEARLGEGETPTIDLVKHPTFRVPVEENASATLRAAGGAIMMGSAAEHHIVNCDFVRNKANAYPAVFTMNPTVKQNDAVNTHDYSQIINTVAWGNEVNIVDPSNQLYKDASKLMVNIGKKSRTQDYITTKTTDATKFYDPSFKSGNVPSKADLSVTNAEATGDWQEAVWFCAYEDGVGFKPNNTNDLRDKIIYSAGSYAPNMIKDANDQTYQNCNIEIVASNSDVAGPNFGNPSARAGYDGFTESADWSPARFNRLTDNGNGWIKQSVKVVDKDYVVTFHNNEALGTGFQGAYPYTHYISDIVPGQFPEYKLWLAIGNEKYMQATSQNEASAKTINGTNIGTPKKNLPRIAPDPTMDVTKAYIDIGVYEYIKQPLLKPGNEVDILWVSTKENPDEGAADGSTWKRPTSDLQRAIKTLLSSRNGHKKEIRLLEGEYAPVTPQTVNGTKYNAFVIDTKSLNGSVVTPSSFATGDPKDFYAQSLTIKGGYSAEIEYEYDPAQYKTVIRQNDADGANTNHLIYVADPTVRYAMKDGYKDTNKYGAIGSADPGQDAASVKTMPIQVDGVTLINDKAVAGTKGSAIYYPDYTETTPEAGVTGAHTVSVGGKVVYYTDPEHKTLSPDNAETDYPLIVDDGATTVKDTKILITKTLVVGSGKPEGDTPATASAVYIGQKGGAALIYNSVFHSNFGMPLDAWNTINVNNTFGKNKGLVHLQDDDAVSVKSQIHNSALWRNNNDGAQFDMPSVTVETTEGDTKGDVGGSGIANFTYNSFTGGNTKYADYNEVSGHVANNNYNTGLSDNNKDLANGPNFVDPENADIYARNFDIRPSVRLLNKGNGTRTPAVAPATADTYGGLYNTLVVNSKYDFALVSSTDKDVLSRMRIVSEGTPQTIDVGAYEFQGNLQQVLYVDPNMSHRDAATGENWDKAFGYSDLQNAMDLAGIYHMNSVTKEESYVFVKGNSSTNTGMNTNETLTIRDGVTVYGSIPDNYTDWHKIKDEHGDQKYSTLEDFIADMKSQREGVASNAANKTIVTGIKTSEYTSFNGTYTDRTDPENPVVKSIPAIVDGFVVTNPNETDAPVFDVTNTSEKAVIVVRNVIVADNNVTGGRDVAQISNGLLYEALLRDNKTTGATLRVSNHKETDIIKTRGYAVNVTVEGKTVDADGNSLVDTDGGQIFKSITNSIGNGSGNKAGANAPYGHITNPGISGNFYNIADPNLNFQLTETSKYIDMCATDMDSDNHPTFLPDNLKPFINYVTDRDILGNPRWMRNVSNADMIDRGAFETWKVDKDFYCGGGDNGTNKTLAIAAHFYPHDGSVVYVMENKDLVIDPLGDGEIKPTPENPGFLLVKKGANFYGNGRPVTCAYLAIERDIRKDGNIVAVPYKMDFNNTESVAKVETKNDAAGHADLFLNMRNGSAAYKYSGNERMDWKYIFQTNNTKCWDQISKSDANQGVLFQPYSGEEWYPDDKDIVVRFTGKGNGLTDYIYTENGVSKVVTLTKNDDAESTGAGADYTDEKDMGWNCFGIPYLVSNYEPYKKVTVTDAAKNTVSYDNVGQYTMYNPHTLWLYYDGTKSPDGNKVDGDGGYYSVKAWQGTDAAWHVTSGSAKSIWVGEGIFTQTATLDDTEDLTFYLPVYVAPTSGGAKAITTKRYYADATGIEETEMTDVELIGTEYYTADGIRIETPRRGQVVIIRSLYSNGAAKTSKQFVK